MLPKPLLDKKIRFFKFWSNHQLQDGLHYQNELFYRIQTLASENRFQLYQRGKHLANQGADILITQDPEHPDRHSLWVSLRSHPRVLGRLQPLPPSAIYGTSSALAPKLVQPLAATPA